MRASRLALAAVTALATALSAAAPAAAHDVTQDGITVVHPMARPNLSGRTSAAYMAIANDGTETERFLGASSPAFDALELHESYEENGVMKMRPVESLEIAPGDAALLEQGGLHLMLIGARQAHAAGEQFPLTLIFERAGEIDVPVMVDEIGAAAGAGGSAAGHEAHGTHARHGAPATQ